MMPEPPLQFVGLYLSSERSQSRRCTLAASILDAEGRLLFTGEAPTALVGGRKLPDPAWVLRLMEGLIGPCLPEWRPSIGACLIEPQGAKRPSHAAAASASAATCLKMAAHPVARVVRRELESYAQAGSRKGSRDVGAVVADAFRGRWGARPFPGPDQAWACLVAEFNRERAQERKAS